MNTKHIHISLHNPASIFAAVGIGGLLLAGMVLIFTPASAGAKFRVRGSVIAVDGENKVITVRLTHVEKGWSGLNLTTNRTYAVRISRTGAKVWRKNAAGKLGVVSVDSIKIGENVGIIGETRADDSLDAQTIVIR